jgi:hypothetical protein
MVILLRALLVMANIPFFNRPKVFMGLFVLALGVAGLITPASTANAADDCPPTRYACNTDESRARDYCVTDRANAQGAIWFNNTGSAPNTDGYYALGVNIAANATNVSVNIRGSVFSCGQLTSGGASVYAVDIRPDDHFGEFPLSRLLTITGPNFLNRGQYSGAYDRWTSTGSSVTANLDVTGLAPSTGSSGGTETIIVGIFRCYSSNSAGATGKCNTAPIPVIINRAPQPRYTLTPTVTVNPSNGVEPGQSLTAAPVVDSSGNGSAAGINWQLTRFVLPLGATAPSRTENGTSPIDYFRNGAQTASTGTRDFPSGVTNLDAYSSVTEDIKAGDQVCFALSVRPYTNENTANLWRHSDPACSPVSKKPKVQVLGGDLIVGRGTYGNPAVVSNVSTSTSYSSNTSAFYGSWSEYAIIPSGTTKGMASGAMYAGGSGGSDLCQLSVLTISNVPGSASGCNPESVGKYVSGAIAPNIASRFPQPSSAQAAQIISSPSVDLFTRARSLVHTTTARQATLSVSSSQPFEAGHWVVLNAPDTTVTITSDINYTAANISRAEDIPQVVIIAKNIIIADNVNNVDAWLIATGTSTAAQPIAGYINTCGSVPAGTPSSASLNTATCGGRLTVNGPVQANKLYLYRTAGAGTNEDMGDPAEVFNLRGDAYLWASSYNPSSGRLPTVSSKELPPRF